SLTPRPLTCSVASCARRSPPRPRPRSSGSASLQINSLSVRTHSITAVYSGDTTFSGSTSGAVSQIVDTPPAATADWYVVVKNGALVVGATGVLGNDSDVDAGQTVAVASPVLVPAATGNGTLDYLNEDGTISYKPGQGFT